VGRPAFYLAITAFIIAGTVPVVLGFRRWDAPKAVALGWAVIAIVVQSVTVLGYFYPRPFGWTKKDVVVPDAPDVIPTAIFALVVAFVAYIIGLTASLFAKRWR
jgi:hypothetical protein